MLTSCDDGGEYVVHDDGVYYSYWTFSFGTVSDSLPDADPATFKSIVKWLGRDAKHAYFKARLIEGADPATIKADRYPVARDTRDVYFYGAALHVADIATFKILNSDDLHMWAADSRCVYYDSLRVDSADRATFKVVDIFVGKDKNHVYRFGEILPEADPATYKEDTWGYATDKNHVWYYGDLLPDVDRATFVIDDAESGMAHDKNGPIEAGKRPGADVDDDTTEVEYEIVEEVPR